MIKKHGIQDDIFVEVTDEDKVSWIEIINPTDDEINETIKKYDLPRDYLFDVNDPYEVSRVEGLEDERPNLFALSYPIKVSASSYFTRVVSVIVVNDLVITVRSEDSEVFNDIRLNNFSKVKEDGGIDNFVIELGWIISKVFIKYIGDLNKEIDNIEKTIRNSTKTDSLYDLIDIQKSLIHFQTAIKENNPVIKSMFDLEDISRSKYKDEHLHDLMVENKQARIMIDKSTTMVNNLSDLFSNVISNNLNSIMKILTSITIVMTIPTIIGGLWGMNVHVPIEENFHAFWYLILLSVVISTIIMWILKKKDLL